MAVTRQALLHALDAAGDEGRTARGLVRDVGGARGEVRSVRAMLAGLVRSGAVTRREGRYALAGPRTGERPAPAGRRRRRDPAVPDRPPGGRRREETAGRPEAPRRRVREAPSGGVREAPSDGRRRSSGGRGREGAAAGRPGTRIGIVVPGRRGNAIRPYPDDGSFLVGGARDLEPGTVVTLEPGRRGLAPAATLGRAGDPEADHAAIAAAHGLPAAFPPACEAEARAVPARIPAAERRRRTDLRALPLVTIDPASARDHDDAVAVLPREDGGARLVVAIADVAHYVPEGGALDREARERANTVYFPDRAVPMLPERLASDLCSLLPDVDRLAMAVELDLDAEGAVERARVFPAVIRSRARLVYEEVAEAMAGRASHPDVEVQAGLEALATLTARLTARRLGEGSIDLELPETRLVLDAEGRPAGARRVARTPAHRAVEEAMLAANRAVAGLLDVARQPALFRVHEAPDPEALESVADAVAGFGAAGRRAARLLEEGHVNRALGLFDPEAPETRGVHLLVLRAMKQARYAARDEGHYALAFDAYTHFTSPIRRYADLVVHRAVKARLEGARTRGAGLSSLARHLSERERAAMAAERQMFALKATAWMATRRGEVAEGLVSGVISHGIFVTLLESGLDGFVPARELGAGVRFDERRRVLSVQSPRQRFRLGDRLRVAVASADLARGRVRFERVGSPGDARPGASERGRAKARGRGRTSESGTPRSRRQPSTTRPSRAGRPKRPGKGRPSPAAAKAKRGRAAEPSSGRADERKRGGGKGRPRSPRGKGRRRPKP